jgi:hypothetical protein
MNHTTKITSVLGTVALGMALCAPAAHAVTARAAINAYTAEKAQLQTVQADIKAQIADFKQNLAKIKSATPEEKRTFAVNVYAKANTFFTTEHDQFVAALETAKAQGVDVSEAQAHFDKAWQLILDANADAKSLASADLSTKTYAQAKAYAKNAEAGYVQVRSELRAGATALKASIVAHYHLTASTTSTDGSTGATASATTQ